MRRTHKRRPSSVAVLGHGALAIALVIAPSACRHQEPESISLGALLPLTGARASHGEYARNGISLAVTEINAAGGVNGKPLRIIYEDSETEVRGGVPAFQKLMNADRVPATLATLNSVILACAVHANRRKSVLFNCGAQDARVRSAGAFVFNGIPDANDEAQVMAEFAVTRLHITDAAMLTIERAVGVERLAVDSNPGVATAAAFARAFSRLGGRIVAEERLQLGGGDARPQLARLMALKPSAVYCVGPATLVARALRQALELGLRTHWLSDSLFQGADVVAAAGLAAEGVIYTYPHFSPAVSPRAKQYAAAYRARFGFDAEVYAATFYDGVYALKAAMEAGGGFTGEDIARGLRMSAYDGVAGPIDFTQSTWVAKLLEFRTVKGGRVQVVSAR